MGVRWGVGAAGCRGSGAGEGRQQKQKGVSSLGLLPGLSYPQSWQVS